MHRKLGLFGFVFVVSPTQFAENLCAVWHGTNSGVFFRMKWSVWFRLTLHFTDNDRNYNLSSCHCELSCKERRLVSFVFNSAFGSPQFVIFLNSPFEVQRYIFTMTSRHEHAPQRLVILRCCVNVFQSFKCNTIFTMRYDKF